MSALKNIIVIGGSGNVGSAILDALVDRKSEFGTIAALKREGHPTSDVLKGLEKRGVKILEANLKDKDSLAKVFKGFDAVVSTINHPIFDDQYLYVDAAIEAKVKRFIPSDFGSNTNLPDVAWIPYVQPKIKLLHYIEEKARDGLIEYTSIITGGLAEFAITSEFYGINFKDRVFHRIGDGTKPITFTALPDVGKFTVEVLLNPELTKNQEVYTASYTCNYVSLIEELEKETGEKFTIIEATPEEQIAQGFPEPLVQMRTMLLDGRGVTDRGGFQLWNDKFPHVKPMTLSEVVKKAVSELKKL